MALVLLPCDLPTWGTVQKHLNHLRLATNENEVVTGMSKIHQLCCVSLDPDEDDSEVKSFEMLRKYLASLGDAESVEFYNTTIPTLVDYAIRLKIHKPESGLCYSLQQQNGGFSLERAFVASLLACAFFSCFPKRTPKTHPTLRDFNFAPFFKKLDRIDQQIKLRCFFRYINRLSESAPTGTVTFKRRVMPAKEHLKIEDWAECRKPLCPIVVRSEGKVDQAEDGVTRCVFGNPGVGSSLFCSPDSSKYHSQDEVGKMFTRPEMMVALCCVETLEDNEALCIDGARQFSDVKITVSPAAGPACEEQLSGSKKIDNVARTECRLCIIDAEDFSECPVSQYEDIWILRELNKALVGFDSPEDCVRLSPLGESRSGSPEPPQSQQKIPANGPTNGTDNPPSSGHPVEGLCTIPTFPSHKGVCCLQDLAPSMTVSLDAETAFRLRSLDASTKDESTDSGACEKPDTADEPACVEKAESATSAWRRKSSAFARSRLMSSDSPYQTCYEDSEEFESATSSMDQHDDLVRRRRSKSTKSHPPPVSPIKHQTTESSEDCDVELGASAATMAGARSSEDIRDGLRRRSSTRRGTFADRLKEALDRQAEEDNKGTEEEETKIAVTESVLEPPKIAPDCNPLSLLVQQATTSDCAEKSRDWLDSNLSASVCESPSSALSRGNSSRYSFSSEYSSDVEEMCEKFSHWFVAPEDKELDQRDLALAKFAQNLLIRTLSDSFAAVAIAGTTSDPSAAINLENTRRMISVKRRQRSIAIEAGQKSRSVPPGDVAMKQSRSRLKPSDAKKKDVKGGQKSSRSERHFSKSCKLDVMANSMATDILNHALAHPPLHPDTLEGFSWTLAEGLIESVIREEEEKRKAARIKIPSKPKSKGILKNRSKSYWHIGSSSEENLREKILQMKDSDECPLSRKVFHSANKPLARLLAESSLQRSSSWHSLFYDKKHGHEEPMANGMKADSATHLPDLPVIVVNDVNAVFLNGDAGTCEKTEEEIQQNAVQASSKPAVRFMPGLPRPIATGNWGCGEKKGDPQLKFVLQWLAASMCNTPCLVYYSQKHPNLAKVEDIIRVLKEQEWTVGDLICLILEFSQSALLSLHRKHTSMSTSMEDDHDAQKAMSLESELFDYIMSRKGPKPQISDSQTSAV